MTAPKRKPAARKAPAPVEQPAPQVEPEQPAPEVPPVEPEPSEKVRKLVHAVRTHNGTGQRFEPEPGVVLMFGYSGLSRVLSGNVHVHIATVAELDVMSAQQVYDAVMQSGVRR